MINEEEDDLGIAKFLSKLRSLSRNKKIVAILSLCLVIGIGSYFVASAAVSYFGQTQTGTQDINSAPTPTPTPVPTATPTPTPTASPAPIVTGDTDNFYLPPATVGVISSSYASTTLLSASIQQPPANPVLSITTTGTTQLYLIISSPNSATLTSNYSNLQIFVYDHNAAQPAPLLNSGGLDLLSTNSFVYALPLGAGTYTFDYAVHYTANAPGVAVPTTLSISVTDTP